MNDITKVGETLNAKETMNNSDNFELIKITERNGKNVVSAKELYDFLGYDRSQWSRWYQTNIINNEYAEVNVDYEALDTVSNGNHTKEFAITIDFAKELSMLSRTENGKKARLYFIKCEKKLMNKFSIPQTYSEALLLASNQAKQIEEQQKLIEVQIPKVEFFDAVADSKTAVTMNNVSKVLGIKGYGRNNLFEFLRKRNILMRNNQPYQKYVDLGYFRVIEQRYQKNNEECINFKTLVYQKGVDFIRKTILSNPLNIGKKYKELNK